MKKTTEYFSLLLFLLFLLPAPVLSGGFKIMPERIFWDSSSKTTILTIINQTEEKNAFQINPMAWTQDQSGKDRYAPAKDIVVFPKILTIEAGEKKIIRLGYQGELPPSSEKTYRVFIRQLPPSTPGEKGKVRVLMRLGVPAFISPSEKKQKVSIEPSEMTGGNLLVKIRNSGNAHVVIQKVYAKGLDRNGKEVFVKEIRGWYVLPGKVRDFPIKISRAECQQTDKIYVTAEAKDFRKESTLTIDKAMCSACKAESKSSLPKKEK